MSEQQGDPAPEHPTVRVPLPDTTIDPLVPPASATPPVAPGWTSPGWSSPTPAPSAPQPLPLPPSTPLPPGPGPGPAYPPPSVPMYAAPAYGAPPALPGVAGWGAVPAAPKPGVIPLRALGVGEILDGAISYIRRDPKTVLGISVLLAATMALLQLVLYAGLASWLGPVFASPIFTPGNGQLSPSEIDALLSDVLGGAAQVAILALVVWIAMVMLNVLATGLLTSAMGRAVLGQEVSPRDVWHRAARRFWPLLGLTALMSLLFFGIATVAVLLSGLILWALAQTSGIAAALLVILVVAVAGLLGLWVYVKLLLAPVALILEDVGPTRALQRSWLLVTGAWWRILGIHLLAVIIAAIVSSVVAAPFSLIASVVSFGTASGSGIADPFTFVQSLVSAFATLVSETIVLPFTAGVVALLYIDRRIRREALDIELARAAGVPGAR